MKKLIMLLAIAAFAAHVNAQIMVDVNTRDVPGVVTAAFSTAYAGVDDVEWSTEGSNYVAEYDDPNSHHDMYVVYDNTGKFIEKRQHVHKRDVPAAIISYLRTNYKEDELRRAYMITDANGVVTYRGKVNGKMIYFDQSGNFISGGKL